MLGPVGRDVARESPAREQRIHRDVGHQVALARRFTADPPDLPDVPGGQVEHVLRVLRRDRVARQRPAAASLQRARPPLLLRSIREEDLPSELRSTLKAFIDRNCQN